MQPPLVRLRARPDTIYLSHGHTVLATDRDGFVSRGSPYGLFVNETRLLSTWRYTINGQTPIANVLSNVEQRSWLGYYVLLAPGAQPERDRGSGHVPPESQHPLELRVYRTAGGGLHEELELTNYSRKTVSFRFNIEIDADFADQAEVLGERQVRGKVTRKKTASAITFAYEARRGRATFRRSVQVRFSPGRPPWRIRLAPGERWSVSIDIGERDSRQSGLSVFHVEAPGQQDLTHVVVGALEQAKRDLAALRLFDLDAGPDAWTVAAGLPLYIALFGRDTLTTGWQAAFLGPEMMRGALSALAKYQGTRDDPSRDEQPGKMLHEAHTGPLSVLGLTSRGRSYGSITTSALYSFILAELWHWTGDKDLVRPFVGPALRALDWLDREGDLDGDGLYEYKTRAKDGVRNQGWKDSPDAIVYEDGRLVEPPIATCEEQGFAYIAKLHLSEMLWWLGDKREARRLFESAVALRQRFNDAFWMEDEGFYALALDAQKRQVRSIASNAGHAVSTAIALGEHVPRVVDRLFAPDLFSGWGIRTLSSDHPSYNPYSYHLGSIWPVEHGTFALGFMRWGLHDRVQQIARAQFEAASLFDFYRLPELFAGHPRDDAHPFPGIYPRANSPQAWSASSVFCLVQAMLGIYPYAPLHLLLVDPHLPDWLPEITLRDLQVGEARVTIRFRGSRYRVLEKKGTLRVIRQPMPWSLTATWAERLRDLLVGLRPTRG